MRITAVTAYPLSFSIPDEHQVKLGIGTTVKRDAVVVKVETSNDIVGWGEAHAARAVTAIAELINTTLQQLVVGLGARDIAAVWEKVYRMQLASHGMGPAAVIGLSGIDLALWDIRGRELGRSIFELLGGKAKSIPAYAGGVSLGFRPVSELISEVDKLLAAGYGALKLRLGDTPERDVERVRAVRDHVGNVIEIMVDVNTAYDLPQIAEIIPALDENIAVWLEEPFPAHDYKSYIAAQALGNTPLAAGENHYTRFDFERVKDDGAITIWQPDLSKTGGISEGLRIAEMADAVGTIIHPHTSVTSINMSASVQFLCAIRNAGYFEADCSTFNPFRNELCTQGYIDMGDGTVCPIDAPGLGIEVDEDFLTKYAAIPGPGYI